MQPDRTLTENRDAATTGSSRSEHPADREIRREQENRETVELFAERIDASSRCAEETTVPGPASAPLGTQPAAGREGSAAPSGSHSSAPAPDPVTAGGKSR